MSHQNEENVQKTKIFFQIELYEPEEYEFNEQTNRYIKKQGGKKRYYTYELDNRQLISRYKFKASFDDIKQIILSQDIFFMGKQIKIKNNLDDNYQDFLEGQEDVYLNINIQQPEALKIDFILKIDQPQYLLQYQQEKQSQQMSKQKALDQQVQNKKKFDILFVKGEGQDDPLHLNSDKEIKNIMQVISQENKQAEIRVATKFNHIKDYVKEYQIEILHVGCHIEKEKEENSSFIKLEDVEHNLKRCSAQDFGEIFFNTQYTPQLVFLNCCYSEVFYEAIKQNTNGLNFICINKDYQIPDKKAIKFAKEFYKELFSKETDVDDKLKNIKNFKKVFNKVQTNLTKDYIKKKKFRQVEKQLSVTKRHQECICLSSMIKSIVDQENYNGIDNEILQYASQFIFYHDEKNQDCKCQFETKFENKDYDYKFQKINQSKQLIEYYKPKTNNNSIINLQIKKLFNDLLSYLQKEKYFEMNSESEGLKSVIKKRNEFIYRALMIYITKYCHFQRFIFYGASDIVMLKQFQHGYPYISQGFYFSNIIINVKKSIKDSISKLNIKTPNNINGNNQILFCYPPKMVKLKQIIGKQIRYKFEDNLKSLSIVIFFRICKADRIGQQNQALMDTIQKQLDNLSLFNQLNKQEQTKKKFILVFNEVTKINLSDENHRKDFENRKKDLEDKIQQLNLMSQINLVISIMDNQIPTEVNDNLIDNILKGIKPNNENITLKGLLELFQKSETTSIEQLNKELLSYIADTNHRRKFKRKLQEMQERMEKSSKFTSKTNLLNKTQLTKALISFFIQQQILILEELDLQYLKQIIEDRKKGQYGSINPQQLDFYSFKDFLSLFSLGILGNTQLTIFERITFRELIKCPRFLKEKNEIMQNIILIYLEDLSSSPPKFSETIKEEKIFDIIESYEQLNQAANQQIDLNQSVQFIRTNRILKLSQMNSNIFQFQFFNIIKNLLEKSYVKTGSFDNALKKTQSTAVHENEQSTTVFIHRNSEYFKQNQPDIKNKCLQYMITAQQVQIAFNFYSSIDEDLRNISHLFFSHDNWFHIESLIKEKQKENSMTMLQRIILYCSTLTILKIKCNFILLKYCKDCQHSKDYNFPKLIKKARFYDKEINEFIQTMKIYSKEEIDSQIEEKIEFEQNENNITIWKTFLKSENQLTVQNNLEFDEYQYQRIITNWMNYFQDQYIFIEGNYEEIAENIQIDKSLMNTLNYNQLLSVFNKLTQNKKDFYHDIQKVFSRICLIQYYCSFQNEERFLMTKNTCEEIDNLMKDKKIRALYQFSVIKKKKFLRQEKIYEDFPKILIIDEGGDFQQDGYVKVQSMNKLLQVQDMNYTEMKKIDKSNIKLIFVFSNSKTYLDYFEDKYHIIYLDDSSEDLNTQGMYSLFKSFLQECIIQLANPTNQNQIGSIFQKAISIFAKTKESHPNLKVFLDNIQFKSPKNNNTDIGLLLLSSQNQESHCEYLKEEKIRLLFQDTQQLSEQIESYLFKKNKTFSISSQTSKKDLKDLIQYLITLYGFNHNTIEYINQSDSGIVNEQYQTDQNFDIQPHESLYMIHTNTNDPNQGQPNQPILEQQKENINHQQLQNENFSKKQQITKQLTKQIFQTMISMEYKKSFYQQFKNILENLSIDYRIHKEYLTCKEKINRLKTFKTYGTLKKQEEELIKELKYKYENDQKENKVINLKQNINQIILDQLQKKEKEREMKENQDSSISKQEEENKQINNEVIKISHKNQIEFREQQKINSKDIKDNNGYKSNKSNLNLKSNTQSQIYIEDRQNTKSNLPSQYQNNQYNMDTGGIVIEEGIIGEDDDDEGEEEEEIEEEKDVIHNQNNQINYYDDLDVKL